MIEIIIFCVFFGALVTGSLVAEALGKLPDAVQLEIEDHRRWAQIKRDI